MFLNFLVLTLLDSKLLIGENESPRNQSPQQEGFSQGSFIPCEAVPYLAFQQARVMCSEMGSNIHKPIQHGFQGHSEPFSWRENFSLSQQREKNNPKVLTQNGPIFKVGTKKINNLIMFSATGSLYFRKISVPGRRGFLLPNPQQRFPMERS